jgi:propanediol dehydratase small subunit
MWQIIAILFFAGVLYALLEFKTRRMLHPYAERACTGFCWKRQFPEASNREIRQFLDIFIEAFGFRDNLRLRFTPEDRVMDIYRVLYPTRGMADGMELETLVGDLEKSYRVNVDATWREDITLGDLFLQTRPSGNS